MILGILLYGFASRFFERSKCDMLRQFVSQAARITMYNYAANNGEYVEESTISSAYSLVSHSLNAEVFLANEDGRVIVTVSSGADSLTGIVRPASVSPAVTAAAIQDGIYEEMGDMHGYFDRKYYVVAMPVFHEGTAFGVVFTACPADDLVDFLQELVKMFCVSVIVVLAIVFLIIYFITARLVSPLKNMLDATNSFTRGDFSKRVPVSGYDEMGQLSMAFNNMASTLAATESTRRSFIANVSHELKTPMTTISGFVDGILDGTIPEDNRDQYLGIVSNECKRLTRLVRSMLDMARLEAGELELRPVLFDISETIRQTVFVFVKTLEDKQVDIRGLDTDRILVRADKDLMHQVVYNLIENAVKFVNPNGYIEVSYRIQPDMTYIAIKNSGPGIEKSELTQLFERFYKSDRSRSVNKDGVGLGLHIVRSIVHYHHGEITVESEPGEYAEFEFSIQTYHGEGGAFPR
ncbi:HAMP domain-containing histidine kinase [Ruminococcaceae bacterium OttesenSCG-928-L11]|nr:HAMP domain-containing histidine kinase [Ruminococcaceae bacterium OttesenSCG-928-L11]